MIVRIFSFLVWGMCLSSTVFAAESKAVFAAGCFWCSESNFEKVEGVISVVSGYTGGAIEHPSYEQVSGGGTGHFESVEVTYDPAKVSYGHLLEVFWHSADPLDGAGQFCDKGDQYRSAIFYVGDDEKKQAEDSLKETARGLGTEVKTLILPAGVFWPAEEYHQDYYKKNPIRYRFYRNGCGRDERLKEIWGDKANSH